ncbi:hypothetical protein L1987_18267 [Smallanthus sonchifolius]|uniref:Uncharacterized protein n=1 Tax=Smallanthus sonchifolius TaxID=185202 RepID=A0ACB9J1F9_9ASTR|nr:hypothetical protein L1987_18267 [Smallanthus sonchifolius]
MPYNMSMHDVWIDCAKSGQISQVESRDWGIQYNTTLEEASRGAYFLGLQNFGRLIENTDLPLHRRAGDYAGDYVCLYGTNGRDSVIGKQTSQERMYSFVETLTYQISWTAIADLLLIRSETYHSTISI